MANLLRHHGVPMTESLAFGLSSGLSFAYLPFIKLSGLPLIAYRMPPRSIIKGLMRPLAARFRFETFASPEAGQSRLDALLAELRPLATQVKETSVAVKEPADMIRTDVALVHDTVQVATDRVKQTVVQLADRVDDFNDLLGSVHEKASMAIDVAGTAMSGLAWGARALRDRRAVRKAKKRSREVPPVKDLDALDG